MLLTNLPVVLLATLASALPVDNTSSDGTKTCSLEVLGQRPATGDSTWPVTVVLRNETTTKEVVRSKIPCQQDSRIRTTASEA